MVPRIFNEALHSMFVACKRQEIAGFASQVSDLEFSAYLEVV
jgi:glutamine synthetase